MGAIVQRVSPKTEAATFQVTETIAYFVSPFTRRRHTHAFARRVNEAYSDAWLACRYRARTGENMDRLVAKKFAGVPVCDLDYLNVTISRANEAELMTFRSMMASVASLAREARVSVFAEAA